jgi:hypothetical protein
VLPPLPIRRGRRVLHALLREKARDLRFLDLAGFRSWLAEARERWSTDPVFVQRARIRDLRRAHPPLRAREREYRRALAADAASPHRARLDALEQELLDLERAVFGLMVALHRAPPEERPARQQKLEAYQARRQAAQDEWARRLQDSPERQALLRAQEQLDGYRAEIGLDHEEAQLDRLLSQQGRRSGRGGASFERQAAALAEERLATDFTPGRGLRFLRGVTLGAARVELDLVLIRRPSRDEQPVEVLAVVEVKRNINDLAHGFQLRQENLAWLTGDASGYDPRQYRTRTFPSGHFDREAAHTEQGETFRFDRRSFRRFHRDATSHLFLDRLSFITRGGTMWGASSAALARISARVASDEAWAPEDDAYLEKLLAWCRSLAEDVEAPDVLRLYTATPRRARQVLIVGD